MLAVIEKGTNGYKVILERQIKSSKKEVWSWLTDNDKLKQWFSELHMEELKKGGKVLFDMHDGTFEEMEILKCEEQSVLKFTWAEDVVQFELYPTEDGCRIVFTEFIKTITNHTPKDIAGWHVCLMVVQSLIEDIPMNARKEEWNKLYPEYVELFKNM